MSALLKWRDAAPSPSSSPSSSSSAIGSSASRADSAPAAPKSGVAPRYSPNAVAEELASLGIDSEQLAYTLWSPRQTSRTRMQALRNAYRTWTTVHTDLGIELGKSWSLTSDDFTRQDEWGCVTYGGECIGLSAFRWVDMRFPFSEDDSYFRAWPREARKIVHALGPQICIGSNITVAHAWRGRRGRFSVKELLLALAIERFNASEATVMAGTLRNARGMGSLGARMGARPVETNIKHPHYGDSIDLVVWEKEPDRIVDARDLTETLTNQLWTRQTEGDSYEALVG